MSENAVANVQDQNTDLLPPELAMVESKYGNDAAFDEVSTAASWLPRLMLMTGNSELVQAGKMNVGRWALVVNKDQFTDLSANVDALILAWRPKALEISSGQAVSIFNPESPEFKRIAQKAATPNSGCMFGPEFLLWIPSEKAFATLFMSSKSARREAPKAKVLMRKAATLKGRFIKTPQYAWHAPVIEPCKTALSVMPELDRLKTEIEKFNNPPETDVEMAPDEQSNGEGEESRPR